MGIQVFPPAASGPTLAEITSSIQTNATRFNATWTNLGFIASSGQTSITFSNLSSYRYLRLLTNYMTGNATSNTQLSLRFNGDSTANIYHWTNAYIIPNSTAANVSIASDSLRLTDSMLPQSFQSTYLEIDNANSSLFKRVVFNSTHQNPNSQAIFSQNSNGIYRSTSAISSITLFLANGGVMFDTAANFGSGPGANGGAYLWGGN